MEPNCSADYGGTSRALPYNQFYKPEKGRYLHPEEDRPITHREAARLQGFPDDFIFAGSKTSIAKQMGMRFRFAGADYRWVRLGDDRKCLEGHGRAMPPSVYGALRLLLSHFEDELKSGDLRSKVRALVPVLQGLRDLGSRSYLKTWPRALVTASCTTFGSIITRSFLAKNSTW